MGYCQRKTFVAGNYRMKQEAAKWQSETFGRQNVE